MTILRDHCVRVLSQRTMFLIPTAYAGLAKLPEMGEALRSVRGTVARRSVPRRERGVHRAPPCIGNPLQREAQGSADHEEHRFNSVGHGSIRVAKTTYKKDRQNEDCRMDEGNSDHDDKPATQRTQSI